MKGRQTGMDIIDRLGRWILMGLIYILFHIVVFLDGCI